MIALLFRKWPVNLIAHLTVCPASVFIVLWKPLLSGDLDLVLISTLAHNIRVLSLNRHASVRATALSLAIMRLNITFPARRWQKAGSLSPAEWPQRPPCVNSRSASVFIIIYLEMGLWRSNPKQKPSPIAEAFFPHPSVRSILQGRRELEGQANRFYLGAAPAQCSSRRQTPNS